MEQIHNTGQGKGFLKIGFSDKVARCVQRQRLGDGMGFIPAEQLYPYCKPGLMVAFSCQEATYPKELVSSIAIARTVDDDLAGCVCVRFFADFAKMERLAVRAGYRNSKLAYQPARAAISLCQDKGYRRIVGHSRTDLVHFWATLSGKVRQDRAEFSFAKFRYREIVLDLPPIEAAIHPNVHPLMLIRPKGDWHRLGPLDISASENDPRRKRMITKRSRPVKNFSFIEA